MTIPLLAVVLLTLGSVGILAGAAVVVRSFTLCVTESPLPPGQSGQAPSREQRAIERRAQEPDETRSIEATVDAVISTLVGLWPSRWPR